MVRACLQAKENPLQALDHGGETGGATGERSADIPDRSPHDVSHLATVAGGTGVDPESAERPQRAPC